jgi:hypothetical protein
VKVDQSKYGTVLSADFARRVVQRVRRVKRRRRVRRWVLTCTALSAAAAALMVSMPAIKPVSPQAPAIVSRQSVDVSSEWITYAMEPGRSRTTSITAVSNPLAFFFPATTAISDFQSSQAASWHSYDPWWNPNP